MSDIAALVAILRHQILLTPYPLVSATALFIYDYVLTLHLEIKYIWRSPWTYTKVLFLLIRYLAFMAVVLNFSDSMFQELSVETCKIMYILVAWFMVIQIALSEVVLCVRTWAVWNRNKAVGIGLVVVILGLLVFECIALKTPYHVVKYPSSLSRLSGCSPSYFESLWPNYAALVIGQSIVFVPMVISAYRTWRTGYSGELSHVIHRDGIIFYFYLLCFTVITLVISIVVPIDMANLLHPLQSLLYAVLTTRLVFRIREVGNRGLETELHTRNDETLVFAMPSQYVLDELRQESTARSQSWTSS